jgi:hypothetical protein
MSWREFFEGLVGDLAWPVTIGMLAVIFRNDVSRLLGKLTGWEGFGQKISFGEGLAQAEEKSAHIEIEPSEPSGSTAPPETVSDDGYAWLVRQAEENPSYVVLTSWEQLTGALADLAGAMSTDKHRPPRTRAPGALLTWLERHGPLTKSTTNAIHSLRDLRNQVAHGQHNPTPGEALAYAELAIDTANEIRKSIPVRDLASEVAPGEGDRRD